MRCLSLQGSGRAQPDLCLKLLYLLFVTVARSVPPNPKGIGNLSSFNCPVPSRGYVGTLIAAKFRMCECCALNAAKTSVSAMLSAGASQSTIRLAVCESCRHKAKARDQDTWRRIEAIVKERNGS